jgi:hypothetical protein
LQELGTADVARLAGIAPGSVRAMVRAKYVTPARGARGSLRFSFQDLMLLKTARDLLAAKLSPRRVGAALRAIRGKLPEGIPARGLSVTATGDRIIVHEAGGKRDVQTGQMLLALEISAAGSKVRAISPPRAEPVAPDDSHRECAQRFAEAIALEDTDIDAAAAAYEVCVTRHAHRGALANLGRLLHLQGRITEAVQLYRSFEDPDADILYNLGVALEDLGKTRDALAAYARVLEIDQGYSDAHHNIARLYQDRGDQQRALRHWNTYRRLTRSTAR